MTEQELSTIKALVESHHDTAQRALDGWDRALKREIGNVIWAFVMGLSLGAAAVYGALHLAGVSLP